MHIRVIPPPVLLLVCLGAGLVAERVRPLPIATYAFETGMAIGMTLFAAGGILAGWALALMAQARTPILPDHDPHRLVTSGPFRISRNPIYVTLVLIMIAFAAMLNSAWLLMGAAVLVVLLDRLVIAGEERMIERGFGEEYREYQARVRRWI